MFTASVVLQQFLNGLALGALYALIASGVAIIFGIVGLINFAQGEFYMLAAYVFFVLLVVLKLPYGITALATVLLMTAFGAFIELLVIRPVVHRPWQTQLVATLGISIFLINIAAVVFGTFPLRAFSPFSARILTIGSFSISEQRLLMIGITILAFLALQQFIQRTKIGKAMRAVSQNREACAAVGINIQLVSMVTFAIGAGLAGLAAALYVPLDTITPGMGQLLVIKAFVVVIMGGFGRIDATIVSAFLLGVVEALTIQYVTTAFVDVLSFLVMVAVLLLRPYGLFGRRIGI
jgi:branched-chain amino acid transport system permease protein